MVPVILAAAGGIAASAAITYYFVSNHGNAKREELLRKMEATLGALASKAEALKEAMRRAEAATRAAEAENRELRENFEELQKELARTEHELADLTTEIERWRASSGTLLSGVAVVGRSKMLYKGKWKHDRVINYLDERRLYAERATLQLGAPKI